MGAMNFDEINCNAKKKDDSTYTSVKSAKLTAYCFAPLDGCNESIFDIEQPLFSQSLRVWICPGKRDVTRPIYYMSPSACIIPF